MKIYSTLEIKIISSSIESVPKVINPLEKEEDKNDPVTVKDLTFLKVEITNKIKLKRSIQIQSKIREREDHKIQVKVSKHNNIVGATFRIYIIKFLTVARTLWREVEVVIQINNKNIT